MSTIAIENIFGFILNIPSDLNLRVWTFERKHWIAIRKLGGVYQNLDSKLKTPSPIGGVNELESYLCEQMAEGDRELILVLQPDVYQAGTWKKEESKSKGQESNGDRKILETDLNSSQTQDDNCEKT